MTEMRFYLSVSSEIASKDLMSLEELYVVHFAGKNLYSEVSVHFRVFDETMSFPSIQSLFLK